MGLKVALLLLSICFVFACGCSERERFSSAPAEDTTLAEWVYGAEQTYEAPTESGGRIVDTITGAIFRFPDGGSGQVTIQELETGPQTASDEGAYEITYDGTGALEILIEHDPEDIDFLVGYTPLNHAVLEGEELDTSGWLPLKSAEALGDTLVFELPVGANKMGSQSMPWSGVKKFKPVRYKKGTTEAVLYAQIEQNVRDALNTLINAVPTSRRTQVMADVNGPLKPVLYMPLNRSAYLFTSTPKYVPYWDSFGLISQCAIVIPDDAMGSVAHEVGHYLHHVLLGNSGYMPFFQNVRPDGHHVGMAGALNELIEAPAYFAEYHLKGSVGGLGPEQGTFLTNGGGGAISPLIVDYRDLEGMTAAMLAMIIRERTEIRNYANERVTVPVVQGERDQLWQDCYEIIASGTADVLGARSKIEALLLNSGQADKLPAMLQAIGWNHHVVCRFVDSEGEPLEGVTARAVSTVGSTEYRLPSRTRESDATGSYGLGQFFPGSNILRVYYEGDSTDIAQTIPWTTPTSTQVDFGDVNVVENETAPEKIDVSFYLDEAEYEATWISSGEVSYHVGVSGLFLSETGTSSLNNNVYNTVWDGDVWGDDTLNGNMSVTILDNPHRVNIHVEQVGISNIGSYNYVVDIDSIPLDRISTHWGPFQGNYYTVERYVERGSSVSRINVIWTSIQTGIITYELINTNCGEGGDAQIQVDVWYPE
jgi:hypothetical protein